MSRSILNVVIDDRGMSTVLDKSIHLHTKVQDIVLVL